MAARLFLIEQHELRQQMRLLAVMALAQSGDGRAIQEQIERWDRDL